MLSHLFTNWKLKFASWPFQKYACELLAKTQIKMLANTLRVPRLPEETNNDYFKKRGTIASELLRATGSWPVWWAKAAVGWSEHLLRERNSYVWAHGLLAYRDAEFLKERRVRAGSQSALAGTLASRKAKRVLQRFHDGFEAASSFGALGRWA